MTKISDALSVRSERLKDLRSIIEGWKGLQPLLGVAARFSLVIDTNVVLGDILWLVAERRDLAAKTQLMETMEAGTLDVYVPPKLIDEVEEHIPLIASKKGLDEKGMRAEWKIYRKMLKVVPPDEATVQEYRDGVDPDDADFVALAELIGAVGVFTKDKHIGMMGGNTISIECIAHLRNYSRSTAVELNIKVNGVLFSIVGMRAINALIDGAKLLVERIGSAPAWIKALLLAGVAFVVLNPRTRGTVGRILSTTYLKLGDAVPKVLSWVAEASQVASTRRAEAQSHLGRALPELDRSPKPAE